MKLVRIKIKRQKNSESAPYWDTFEVNANDKMTVFGALKVIRRKSVNINEEAVPPLVWEGCNLPGKNRVVLMINGKPRFLDMTLVSDLVDPIKIEPLGKFPVLRDLIVDRSDVYRNFKDIHAWASIDGLNVPRVLNHPELNRNELVMDLSRCTACGACMEACPQYHNRSDFRGAMIVSQVYRFNELSSGQATQKMRLQKMVEKGGVLDCGNAQNCVKACPYDISITDALGMVKRESRQFVRHHFLGKR